MQPQGLICGLCIHNEPKQAILPTHGNILLIFRCPPCIIIAENGFSRCDFQHFPRLIIPDERRCDRSAGGGILHLTHKPEFRPIGATTFLSPIPAVMLSCRGTQEGFTRDNLITVAWAGVVNSDPPMISVSIRPQRHSHAQIVQSGAFCLNLIDKALCRATDYCGVKSGRDVDKFAEMRLHARTVEGFPAPALEEAPAFLCCRVKQRIPLGSHDLFLSEVEQVYVRDDLFDADGSLHIARAGLIAYAHGEYFPLQGRPEGFFGYSLAREEVLKRRLHDAYPRQKGHASARQRGPRPDRRR